jgi:thioredoxin-related protein
MAKVENNRTLIIIGIFLFANLFMIAFCGCKPKVQNFDLSDYIGVYADKNSELVQTEKYTLIFNRQGLEISAILRKVVKEQETLYSQFLAGYVFDAIDKSYQSIKPGESRQKMLFEDLLTLKDNGLEVKMNSHPVVLKQIEQINVCVPHDMPRARKGKIGECLQHWQLGTTEQKMTPDDLHLTIGTNKHLYIFQSNEDMLYCRAARIRHNEKGSVFSQNIRLMFNSKSDEQTVYMFHDNLKMAQSEIQINNTLFKPDACSFEKGGIYWSLISHQPDTIRLNGCSETYTYSRPLKTDNKRVEWFVYKDY